MKKIENNFTVTGFVGNNAEIRQFTTASVARFSLAVSRQEKNGEETNRVSAFISMEAWRKNEHTESFDQLTKGTLLTVEGYFKPDEWIDQQGTKHNRIVFIANKFYPALEKRNLVQKALSSLPLKQRRNSLLSDLQTSRFRPLCLFSCLQIPLLSSPSPLVHTTYLLL